ncbi:hypothetical protein Phou_078460 [Phytohabitans houttuyneae]|uniref:Uncharacterized protein n=1 Tax=Phytohabitans houttuyneae TaxID=1076126 RepID=A0A6V8KP77_9ACTN|nr:hypothetical protein Phou_078460 [Phytohabitans houttuyneae]
MPATSPEPTDHARRVSNPVNICGQRTSYDFLLADILRPGLTVVAQDDADIGCAAIELLIARGSHPTHPVRTVTLPGMAVPRGRRRTAAVPELLSYRDVCCGPGPGPPSRHLLPTRSGG